MSWSTFRDRWPVFVGAILTVCLGAALVQSSLLTLISAVTVPIPPGLSPAEERAVREGSAAAASLLGLTLGLAFFVTVFIVSSTFAFAVAQRRRDLALLRLTGASRGQMRGLLLGEALLLGGLGSALGVLVGLPVMRVQASLLIRFGFVPAGFAAQWRSWIIAVSMGTGVTVAVLGVLAASGRAARVRPLEALREADVASRVMTASRWVVGGIFLGGGTAMLVLIPGVGGEGALALSILVSMVLVIAFAALAPIVVPLVSWPLRLAARGRLGHIVQANLRTGVRRSASAAAPVMVLVAFVAGIAGSLDSVGEAGRRELVRDLRADLVLTTDRSVAADLSSVDGIAVASEEVPIELEVRVDEGDGVVVSEFADGLAVDPSAFLSTHRLELVAGDLADLSGDTVAVGVGDPSHPAHHVGDVLTVALGDETRDLRVVALLPPSLSGPSYLVPADSRFAAGPRRYLIQVAEGTDPTTVSAEVSRIGAVLTTPEWIRGIAGEQERGSIDIMVVLLGMSMIYTVLAMVNAVVISASDRRTEFATARVSGLTRGETVRMALSESVVVVAIGVLLGGLAAATTVLGMASAIDDLIGISVVAVRWRLLGALALGAAIVIATTTVLTTLAATRTPPVRLVGARE